MNIIITASFFLVSYCCVVHANTSKSCSEAVTAFPPDPTAGCCGMEASGSDKIIPGNITKIDQYPWLALVEYDKNGNLKVFCGGALISSKYVLSGAVCVTGMVLKLYTPKNIILGEYDTSNDGVDCQTDGDQVDCTDGALRIPINKIIPHPEFEQSNRRHLNDIALIRMEQAAPYTDFIRPICLPREDMTLRTEPFYLVKAGWGQVSGLSPIKLQMRLPFVKREDCQKAFSSRSQNINFGKEQFCAGGELGKDSCKGDSGLPLVFQNGQTYEAIGIVSFGFSPCGQNHFPSVYTNIYEYKTWINSNIIA